MRCSALKGNNVAREPEKPSNWKSTQTVQTIQTENLGKDGKTVLISGGCTWIMLLASNLFLVFESGLQQTFRKKTCCFLTNLFVFLHNCPSKLYIFVQVFTFWCFHIFVSCPFHMTASVWEVNQSCLNQNTPTTWCYYKLAYKLPLFYSPNAKIVFMVKHFRFSFFRTEGMSQINKMYL